MSNVINMRPPEFRPGDLKFVGTVILLALIGWAAASQVLIVQEDEYRVIRSFSGAVQRIVVDAGPAVKVPFMQSQASLPKTRQVYNGQPSDILTADQKPIIVDHYTVWQITDPLAFVQNSQSMTRAEQRIQSAVDSTVRAVLGRLNYGAIISEGKSARGDLSSEVTRLVNESLQQSNLGMTVHDVRVKRTDLPETNQASVYNRMRSERDRIAADYLFQGEELSIKIKAATDREASQLVSEAARKAKEIEAEGEAEAARIYNEAYGADPEFYTLYRTLESYKTTLKGKPAIVLPIDSPYAKLLMGR